MADMLAIVKKENYNKNTIIDVININEIDMICNSEIQCLDAFNPLFEIEKKYSDVKISFEFKTLSAFDLIVENITRESLDKETLINRTPQEAIYRLITNLLKKENIDLKLKELLIELRKNIENNSSIKETLKEIKTTLNIKKAICRK